MNDQVRLTLEGHDVERCWSEEEVASDPRARKVTAVAATERVPETSEVPIEATSSKNTWNAIALTTRQTKRFVSGSATGAGQRRDECGETVLAPEEQVDVLDRHHRLLDAVGLEVVHRVAQHREH